MEVFYDSILDSIQESEQKDFLKKHIEIYDYSCYYEHLSKMIMENKISVEDFFKAFDDLYRERKAPYDSEITKAINDLFFEYEKNKKSPEENFITLSSKSRIITANRNT